MRVPPEDGTLFASYENQSIDDFWSGATSTLQATQEALIWDLREIEEPNRVAQAVRHVGQVGAVRVLHANHKFRWIGWIEDHPSAFAPCHANAHEMIQRFRNPIVVGIAGKPNVAARSITVG